MMTKTWTKDSRPVVWTVTEGTRDRYDLYIRGFCVGTGLSFGAWWILYNLYKKAK
jgi:tRNA splicing endonuclease